MEHGSKGGGGAAPASSGDSFTFSHNRSKPVQASPTFIITEVGIAVESNMERLRSALVEVRGCRLASASDVAARSKSVEDGMAVLKSLPDLTEAMEHLQGVASQVDVIKVQLGVEIDLLLELDVQVDVLLELDVEHVGLMKILEWRGIEMCQAASRLIEKARKPMKKIEDFILDFQANGSKYERRNYPAATASDGNLHEVIESAQNAIAAWEQSLADSPQDHTDTLVVKLSDHLCSLARSSCSGSASETYADCNIVMQVAGAMKLEVPFWESKLLDFPTQDLKYVVSGVMRNLGVAKATIARTRAAADEMQNMTTVFESLRTILSKARTSPENIESFCIRILNPGLLETVEILGQKRKELNECVENTKKSFKENASPETMENWKMKRTELRKELISHDEEFVSKMSKLFPEEEHVRNRSILEAVMCTLTKGTFDGVLMKIVAQLSKNIGVCLEKVVVLEREVTLARSEIQQLKMWHEAASGSGISLLSKGTGLRKSLQRNRRKRERLKLDLKDAMDDKDEEAITILSQQIEEAGYAVRATQKTLDDEFRQAAQDVVHFPEESHRLAELLDGPPSLLQYWKDFSLDDFAERELLATGNHDVFKVLKMGSNTHTVLKRFPVDSEARREVKKEAEKMITLQHPNIMPMLSIFWEEADNCSSVFIEMPFCAGGDVVSYVERRQPGLAGLTLVLSQILDAIAHMHAKDVVHGDIKPENILMTTAGMNARPRLTDFGLSKGNSTMTSSGGVGGSRGFMAPEMVSDSSLAPTPASDMWATGEVLRLLKEALRDTDRKAAEERKVDDLIQRLTCEEGHNRISAQQAKSHIFFDTCEAPEPERNCEINVHCDGATLESHGVVCEEGHFVCDDDFTCQVEMLVGSSESLSGEFHRCRGKVYCCNRPQGCRATAFPLAVVAQHVTSPTFDLYLKAREVLLQVELARNNDVVIREEVERELEQLKRMSEFEREVRAARKEIEGNLLNLYCPTCKKTFFDWNNCAALTCRDEKGHGCNTKFCCYCQKILTGENPHAHVLGCPMAGSKPRNVQSKLYPPPWYFNQVCAPAREKRVAALLAQLKPEVQREVVKQCAQSFRDLGLRFSEAAPNCQEWDADIAQSLSFGI